MVLIKSDKEGPKLSLYQLNADISIVVGYPFLYLNRTRQLILGDLHFGQENTIINKGNSSVGITKDTKELVANISEIVESINVEGIILNGDIKHDTNRINNQELEELRYFLTSLPFEPNNIQLIKGNHDKLLDLCLRKMKLTIFNCTDHLDIPPYFISHGHLNLELTDAHKYIIIGHEHPSYVFRGNNYEKVKLPAFVTMRTTDNKLVIILPAANKISSGSKFPPKDNEHFLSPYLRKYGNIKKMKYFPFDIEVGILPIPSHQK